MSTASTTRAFAREGECHRRPMPWPAAVNDRAFARGVSCVSPGEDGRCKELRRDAGFIDDGKSRPCRRMYAALRTIQGSSKCSCKMIDVFDHGRPSVEPPIATVNRHAEVLNVTSQRPDTPPAVRQERSHASPPSGARQHFVHAAEAAASICTMSIAPRSMNCFEEDAVLAHLASRSGDFRRCDRLRGCAMALDSSGLVGSR